MSLLSRCSCCFHITAIHAGSCEDMESDSHGTSAPEVRDGSDSQMFDPSSSPCLD